MALITDCCCADCHSCWVSQTNPICWVSLCWVSLWRVSRR